QFLRNAAQHVQGSHTREVLLLVNVGGRRAFGYASANDDDRLASFVAEVEGGARQLVAGDLPDTLARPEPFVDPQVYYESTLESPTPEAQTEVIRRSAARIDAAGLIG